MVKPKLEQRTKIYTEKPPKSARSALRAWKYFSAKYKGRGIRELYYSANYDYTGVPHWVCTLTLIDSDTKHCGFVPNALTFTIPSWLLERKEV